jgi:hypothetical protein
LQFLRTTKERYKKRRETLQKKGLHYQGQRLVLAASPTSQFLYTLFAGLFVHNPQFAVPTVDLYLPAPHLTHCWYPLIRAVPSGLSMPTPQFWHGGLFSVLPLQYVVTS